MKIFEQTIKQNKGISKREFLHFNANFLTRRCVDRRLCESFPICKRNGIKIRLSSMQAIGKSYQIKEPNLILYLDPSARGNGGMSKYQFVFLQTLQKTCLEYEVEFRTQVNEVVFSA